MAQKPIIDVFITKSMATYCCTGSLYMVNRDEGKRKRKRKRKRKVEEEEGRGRGRGRGKGSK